MKATGVNLTLLCQLEQSDSKIVDCILASTDLEGLITQAEKGDREAAKSILALASGYLRSDVFGAMPRELRRYLGLALAKASLGKSADITLNLTNQRGGRPRQNHRTKLRLAHWIYKEMKAGKSLEEASAALSIAFADDYFAQDSTPGQTIYGYTTAPNEKTLQGIYRQALPEIEDAYKQVRDARAALETSEVFK